MTAEAVSRAVAQAPSAGTSGWLTAAAPSAERLHYRTWGAGGGSDSGRPTVVIMHGYGEHAGSYAQLASYLAERGYPVFALDARGHGHSGGQRGHITAYAHYASDLERFIEHTRALAPGRGVVLLGHSAGGLIATRALQARPGLCDVLILSSPLFELHARHKPLPDAVARLLAVAMPRVPLPNGIADSELTRDPVVLAGYKRDRLRHHRTTPAWYVATLDAMERARSEASRITLPLLLLAGEHDSIADRVATALVATLASSTDKEMLVRDGALHEVLNELDRVELYGRIHAWISARVPARGG